MKENSIEISKLKRIDEEESLDSQKSFLKNGIEEKKKMDNYESDLRNDAKKNFNTIFTDNTQINKNECLNRKEKGEKNDQIHLQNISNDNLIPKIVKKYINITHKEGKISYVYTLVSYKNYNIFFITHNGKFASWVYSYNVIMPFSVEQETEIIFGERNYPFLEIFCSKFMKDHASLLKYKPIMFAMSIYNMCFNDKNILTQIFDNLSILIK